MKKILIIVVLVIAILVIAVWGAVIPCKVNEEITAYWYEIPVIKRYFLLTIQKIDGGQYIWARAY